MLGYKNPYGEGTNYMDQIPGQAGTLDPWGNAGKTQLNQTGEQYTQLQNDPGKRLNEIGEGYQQSPGLKFAIQQAMQAGNNSAAAGGMSGSPEAQYRNMAEAQGLANQDYYKYLDSATGLYKTGLEGGQTQANQGQNATKDKAEMMNQYYQQKTQDAQNKTQYNNESISGGIKDALHLASGLFF